MFKKCINPKNYLLYIIVIDKNLTNVFNIPNKTFNAFESLITSKFQFRMLIIYFPIN